MMPLLDIGLCVKITMCGLLYFFFQAEDGIRDDLVTRVQTCALPISSTGHSRSGRDANSERLSGTAPVACPHPALLAGAGLGGFVAADLFPSLVGHVWDAQPSRLDVPAVRDGPAANDRYLHGSRVGFSRFVRRRSYRSKRKFLHASRLVFLARLCHDCRQHLQRGRSEWQVASSDEPRLPCSLWHDSSHRRVYAARMVSQNARPILDRSVRSLHHSSFRSPAIA